MRTFAHLLLSLWANGAVLLKNSLLLLWQSLTGKIFHMSPHSPPLSSNTFLCSQIFRSFFLPILFLISVGWLFDGDMQHREHGEGKGWIRSYPTVILGQRSTEVMYCIIGLAGFELAATDCKACLLCRLLYKLQ